MEETKVENQNVEPVKQEVAPEPTPVAQTEEKTAQESWKYMREELERARELAARERQEKEMLLRQMSEKPQTPQEIEEPKFAEEAYIEGKDLNKQQQAINLKLKREQEAREASEKRMYEMLVENRLLQEHPDMREVLSDANLKKLKEMKPDLAKSILSNPDPYSQHKTAIDAVKTFVLPDRTEAKKLEKQAEKASVNLSKPMPSTSSASPLTQATAFADKDLTNEDKSEIYKSWVKKTHGSYYNFKK